MQKLISLISGTPESGLYHPDHPALYSPHDTLTSLADCPFPLETATFKVIAFGDTTQNGGTGLPPGKVAIVEYTKHCGHTAQDRIGFFEGVQDFDHYGTKFAGKSYSITNWENRIECFRQTLCPVCDMYEHCRWAHFHAGERTAARKRTLARFDLLMNANFGNWQDYVSREDFEKAIQSPENPALSLRK